MEEARRNLWKLLWQDCVQLHSEIDEFCYLYADDKSRVSLMNEATGVFFASLQRTLWNSILLQLCRITDPPQTTGKENLSLRYFLKASAADRESLAQDRACELVELAKQKSDFARNWRDKRIAHRDLSVASGASLCDEDTIFRIKEAAAAIAKAMDSLDPDGAETHWSPGVSATGSPMLLRYLQEGMLSHQQRAKAQRRGDLPFGDIWLKKPPPDDELK